MNVDDVMQQPGQMERNIKAAIKGENHYALPGVVKGFDKEKQTATIQPTLRRRKGNENIQLPLLLDVPVYFFGGKDGGITFPVQEGDECLVIFADACIDAWFQNGTVSNVISVRQHDYSDGFAFVGFRSLPNVLKGDDFPDEPAFWGIKKSELGG